MYVYIYIVKKEYLLHEKETIHVKRNNLKKRLFPSKETIYVMEKRLSTSKETIHVFWVYCHDEDGRNFL